ncbi:OOP family OmpA-OmpF porin [Litorivivens lipolytica]|uniref:OOP family OmpA-OmpF porin n=1 Tax=Litorivivens lipolytica TaxID=1524264 RepID=A0A7W4W6L4_9GAMM|nr:OmpA family protein [Litorivivens lipolytica]MBB3048446.1 OOP family OmpA-OmpF porin [Litorivivens lipolytica]
MTTSIQWARWRTWAAGAVLACTTLPTLAENNWYISAEYGRQRIFAAEDDKVYQPSTAPSGACLGGAFAIPGVGNCGNPSLFDDRIHNYDDDDGFGLSVGYNFEGPVRVDLSAKQMKNEADYVRIDGGPRQDVDFTQEAQALLTNLWFDFNEDGVVQPYVGLGVGAAKMKLAGAQANNLDDTTLFAQAGFGMNFVVTDSFMMDFGARYFEADKPEYENFLAEYHGAGLVLGFRYNFEGKDSADGDSDGDGVRNADDRCPHTPRGDRVNKFGCSDSDGDGVADNLDRCPSTPPGTPVNEFGCSDLDGDGVVDGQDLCPGTPVGTQVDGNGCSDVDGDGVTDRVDACPDSVPNKPVMSNGCGVQQSVVLEGVNFEFDSARLQPNAQRILDLVAKSLKESPNFVVEIQGHTDNVGSDAYNLILSQDRAGAVKAYLISKGVDADAMVARGYGERQPVADNGSEDGRERNRRVEMKVIQER